MVNFTPAQRKAYGIKMAKLRASKSTVSGRGSYKRGGTSRVPKRTTVRGRGDYKKDYGSRLGSVVGEGLQELLTQLGGLAGMGQAVAGLGDYAPIHFKVKENKLAEGTDPPEIRNGNDGSFVMRHREYIKDIYSSGDNSFVIDSLNINPGLAETFPWLASLAQNFEQYKVEGMIFEFRSNFSDATTGSIGTVCMATEYNVNQPNFTNKSVMENHQYGASCKPSQSMLHPIECAQQVTPVDQLCVRTGSNTMTEDLRLCDLGKFQIASVGVNDGGNPSLLGELWVTYQIRFSKTKMPGVGTIVQSDMFQNNTGLSTPNPFGSQSTIEKSSANTLGCTITGEGYVTFPETVGLGTYLVSALWTSSSVTVDYQPAVGALVGCVQGGVNDPFGATWQAPNVVDNCTRNMRTWAITITDTSVTPSFQITKIGAATANYFALFITAIEQGLDVAWEPASIEAFTEHFMASNRPKDHHKDIQEEEPQGLSDPDLSQSTTASINEIIKKAQLKKALFDKAAKNQ